MSNPVATSQTLAPNAYQCACRPVACLNGAQREDMAQLYLRYYEGSDRDRFFFDLDDKDEVLLLYYESAIIGFTTYVVYPFEWDDKLLRIVFSGDTIIEPEHWGQQTFTYAWARRMGEVFSRAPHLPLYWFLIVKGHRTFRYLPLLGENFFPHWKYPPDPQLRALAQSLATARFGSAYDSFSDLICFETSHGHLKRDIAHPSQRELQKASVAFFLERNPGYLRGDELVCLCPLSADNMRPFARRVFLSGRSGP